MEILKKSVTVRVVTGLILSVISAGLLLLAFPPANLWFLVWFSFVPVILAEHRILPPKLSSLAPAAFIGLWITGYMWLLFRSWFHYTIFLAFFLIVLVTIFLCLKGNRAFQVRTGFRWFVVEAVVFWVGIEMIRNIIPGWGSWGFFAYTLHSQPWLIQPASIFGVFGVSALIIMVNHVLGLAAIRLLDKYWILEPDTPGPGHGLTRRWLMITGITMVLWVGLSLVLFRTPSRTDGTCRGNSAIPIS